MFNYDIDQSWDAVKKVLKYYTNGSVKISLMEERWRKAKQPLLDVLGPTGRRVRAMELDDVSAEFALEQRAVVRDVMDMYIDKQHDMRRLSGQETSFVRGVLRVLLSEVTLAEIAQNRLLSDRPDSRPGKEGKMLRGLRLSGYAQYVMIITYPQTIFTATMTDVIVTALSLATAALFKDVRANIVLSVNPLDMLMVSAHTAKWSSCHRLDGDWATGPLSYLLDEVSAVAYVYTKTSPWHVAELDLPVKLWRQMVFFDLNTSSALMSREYPANRVEFGRAARGLTARILHEISGVEDEESVLKYVSCGIDDSDDGDKYQMHIVGRWHYEDYLRHRVRLADLRDIPVVRPGVEEIVCARCGYGRNDGHVDELLCPDCGDYGYTCADCGDFYLESNSERHTYNGSSYCSSCWEDNFTYCYRCDEGVPNDDMRSGPDDLWYCDSCFDHLFTYCVECSEAVKRRGIATDSGGEEYCEDCASQVLIECDRCQDIFHTNASVAYTDCWMCRDCAEEYDAENAQKDEEDNNDHDDDENSSSTRESNATGNAEEPVCVR